ncbi:transposase [Bradyrhizobium sp. Arg816]|uniref:transposase n=1 Tax=Bradyrhizobium sp. Arg816 TaxID=2998491 RepID=UPI0038579C4C
MGHLHDRRRRPLLRFSTRHGEARPPSHSDGDLKAFLTKDTSYKDELPIFGIGQCKGAGRIQFFHPLGPRDRQYLSQRTGYTFAREPLMSWCEDNHVDYLFGFARNTRLLAMIADELTAARATAEKTDQPARRFKDFQWSFKMNAFWAPENFEAFIVVAPPSRVDLRSANSSQKWSSLPASDQSSPLAEIKPSSLKAGERAVRMVLHHRGEYVSRSSAARSAAGCHSACNNIDPLSRGIGPKLALTHMWNGPGCKIFLWLNKG